MGRLLASLAVLAVALSGCVSIAEEQAFQRDEVGDVIVRSIVCAAGARPDTTLEGSAPASTCATGNSGEAAGSGDFQLLLAYRIPLDTTYPESIAAQEGTIALLFSPSFVAELNRLAPIPPSAAQQWVGYISPPFHYGALETEDSATFESHFGLLRDADGAPWAGPFRYRSLVGYRDASPDPARPVACGQSLAEYGDEGTTLCLDWPAPEELSADVSVVTRDLGLIPGPRATVRRGAAVAVTFTAAYDGQAAVQPFTLSAATSIPGGTALPAVATIQPSTTGSTPVAVTVSAPASAAPGDYDVTLVATLPNGQRRVATQLIAVQGRTVVDRTPPEVNVAVGSLPRIGRARKVGVAPEVACSEACRLEAELRLGARQARSLGIPAGSGGSVVVGRMRERALAPGRRRARVRFYKSVAPKIGLARRVSLAYRVVARDAQGNFRVRIARFSLRR